MRLLAAVAAEAADERDPALLDPVAELARARGQDGERAEHRDCDDEHRADREGHERLVAGEEHAGHRDQDGDARDEDGAARGGGGGLERGALAAAGGPLLALTPHVEERVVDADGEADEQDDLHDVLARRRCPGSRARAGPIVATTEVSRAAAGSARRRASRARSCRMMIVSGIEIIPALARPPWISSSSALSVETPSRLDVEAGVAGLDLVDGGGDLVDVEDGLLVGALRRELDQRRVAVLRDQVRVARRSSGDAELRDLRERARASSRRPRSRPGRRDPSTRQRLRLDEHDLALLLDALALLVDREAGVAR